MTYQSDLGDEERRAAIRKRRRDPAWREQGEALVKARQSLARAKRRTHRLDALEQLALAAPTNAVSAAIKGTERWVKEAAEDSGASEDSIAHDIILSYVSVEIISARKTDSRFGIAAEVLRCTLGWSYAETLEWLVTQ
jgi:hypothetical protein